MKVEVSQVGDRMGDSGVALSHEVVGGDVEGEVIAVDTDEEVAEERLLRNVNQEPTRESELLAVDDEDAVESDGAVHL
jgi:hypothetical protein